MGAPARDLTWPEAPDPVLASDGGSSSLTAPRRLHLPGARKGAGLNSPSVIRTEVLIIGGGVTGTALARDLALRGVDCILVEKDDINAGASGRNHGLLHSGARYVAGDREAAMECRAEGDVLKRIAAQAIQDTGGYFVAVPGDDERYIADFPSYCARSGITARAVDVAEARAQEPALSERAIAVFAVPDASIDPFRLSLESMADAQRLGARLMRRTRVVGFEREGRRIVAVRVRSFADGEDVRIEAAQVVNAAGAWAREVAGLAGAPIEMTYSKGTLLVTHTRLASRVVNRLRRPGNADIMMPGGTVSIVGTTSTRVDDLDDVHATAAEADLIVEEAARMVPALATMRYIRAYAGVRPLVGSAGAADGRAVSRGFALFDHENHGLDNLATITGGKLTTCRLMAERTADLVCRRLGVESPLHHRNDAVADGPGMRLDRAGPRPARMDALARAGRPAAVRVRDGVGRCRRCHLRGAARERRHPDADRHRPAQPRRQGRLPGVLLRGAHGGPPLPARRLRGDARPRRDTSTSSPSAGAASARSCGASNWRRPS